MIPRFQAARILREAAARGTPLTGQCFYDLTLAATDNREEAETAYREYLAAQLRAGLVPQ